MILSKCKGRRRKHTHTQSDQVEFEHFLMGDYIEGNPRHWALTKGDVGSCEL